MKTVTHYTMMVLTGACLLVTEPVTAQKVNFSIKEAIESFKRKTDCTYCEHAFSFSRTVKQIHHLTHNLKDLKPKKKRKKLKRLCRIVDGFITNSTMELQGLSEQLNHTTKQEATVTRLIRLKSYTKEILRLFEISPDLLNEASLQTSKTRMVQLNKAIGNTLTQLKKH